MTSAPRAAVGGAGARPGGKREIAAWCLFDFGNSAFTTVIVTTVFSVYFVKTVVPPGGISGELLWSFGTSLSLLVSAVLSPPLGALADARALKRPLLIGSSLACIVCTAALAGVGRGDVLLGLCLFVVANVGFEVGYVFYNSFLPEIAPPDRAGRISGLGWATGYIGGLLSLAVALVPLKLLLPANPSPDDIARGARISFLLVSAHFLAFALPAFVVLRDRATGSPATPFDPLEPLRRVRSTLRGLGRYPQTWKFILANLVYNDGVVTIFIFAGIYMDRVLRFSQAEIILVVLLLNVPSALGSFGFGLASDRIGGKKTILITIALLFATVAAMAAFAPRQGADPDALLRARTAFWILAMVAGFGIGANQSASRGLMALLVPADRHAEFFGFFLFSGKLSSVLAPLTYGLISQLTGSPALAIASVAAFLAVGGALLLLVDEGAGIRDATGAGPPAPASLSRA